MYLSEGVIGRPFLRDWGCYDIFIKKLSVSQGDDKGWEFYSTYWPERVSPRGATEASIYPCRLIHRADFSVWVSGLGQGAGIGRATGVTAEVTFRPAFLFCNSFGTRFESDLGKGWQIPPWSGLSWRLTRNSLFLCYFLWFGQSSSS